MLHDLKMVRNVQITIHFLFNLSGFMLIYASLTFSYFIRTFSKTSSKVSSLTFPFPNISRKKKNISRKYIFFATRKETSFVIKLINFFALLFCIHFTKSTKVVEKAKHFLKKILNLCKHYRIIKYTITHGTYFKALISDL